MSLRYEIPQLRAGCELSQDLKVLPARKPAELVEFRRGAAMDKVVAQVLGTQMVDVSAAMGSGKSTVLPAALCRVGKKQVFHVVPSRLLALDLFMYLGKCANSGLALPPTAYMETVDCELPRKGLIFCGAAEFYAYVLSKKADGVKKVLEGAVVFLDEAHESDAYTEVLRNVCADLGADNVVRASATFQAKGFRKMETGAVLKRGVYACEDTPETWELTGNANPWCVARLRNNLLVFTDSRSQVDILREKYTDHGFLVHRLTANMSDASFVAAMADLRDKKGVLCVLLADYSFRSGFTFDVGTIIDTGRVSYFDVEKKTPVKRSRRMFVLEAEQAAGRGARIDGQDTDYYMPDLEYETAICELEGVEAEAAPLLYRALGFRPPRSFIDTKFYEKFPNFDLNTVLRGRYPVVLYEAIDVPAARAVESRVGTPVGVSPLTSALPTYEATVFADAKQGNCVGNTPEKESDVLWAVLSDVLSEDEIPTVEVGRCYCVDREIHETRVVPGPVFPRGLSSVMRMLDVPDPTHVIRGMRSSDRDVAVKLTLDRYNVLCVELMAILRALQEVAPQVKAARRAKAVKECVVEIVEQASQFDNERHSLLRAFRALCRGWCDPKPVSDVSALVAERCETYLAGIRPKLQVSEGGDAVALRGLESALKSLDTSCQGSSAVKKLEWDKATYRRRSRRSSSSGGSSGSSVELRPPRWMGIKSVTYEREEVLDSSGRLRSAVVATTRPGKLMRHLTGESEVVRVVKGAWVD